MADTLEFTLDKADTSVLDQAIAEQQDTETEKKGPFHGQQGALSGGYVDEPEYRTGMLGFLGLGGTVDRMETPITEQEKMNPVIVEAVQTDAYTGLQTSDERQEFLANAVQEQNLAIQEGVGEPITGRIPNADALYDDAGIESNPNAPKYDAGIRVQKGTEPVTSEFRGDSEQEVSYLVPDPLDGSFERVLKGAGLQMLRSTLSVPEYFYDKYFGGDPSSNETYGMIPVMPAATELEKIGMDIGEVIGGAVTGGSLAKGLLALPGLAKMTPKLAEQMGNVYSKMRKGGAVDYKLAFDKYLKSVLIGSGVITGEALVLDGQNAEPLIGDEFLDALGMEEGGVKDFMGHAIDSTGINAGLIVLGKAAGWIWRQGSGFILPKGTPKGEQLQRTTALLFMQKIDPVMVDGAEESVESLVIKAKVMADVLDENATFKSALNGGSEINLDSAGSIMLGAEDYFRRAYAWKIAELGAEGFEEFVTSSANDLISNINQLKKVVGTSADPEGVVTSATANINRQIGDTMDAASEGAIEGGPEAAVDFLGGMVDEGVDALNTSRGAVQQTEELLSGAEAGLSQSQKDTAKNILMDNAEALGSTKDEVAALNDAAGEQLLQSFLASRQAVDDAYSAITKDIEIDYETFIPALQKIFAKDGSLDFITSTATKEDPIAMFLGQFRPKVLEAATETTPEVVETFEEVVGRIQRSNPDLDLKELYTTLRPKMSDRINALEGTDGASSIQYLTQVKNLIDELVDAADDESFNAAKSAYGTHEGMYGSIPELKQWSATAGQARATVDEAGQIVPQSDAVAEFAMDSRGRPMGVGTALRDAVNLLDQAMGDSTGETASYIARAWAQAGENVTPDIADALLAKTLRAIDTTDPSTINSQALIQTLMPTRTLLESMGEAGKATLDRFDTVVKQLQDAEQGARGAREALEATTEQYNLVQTEINETVASRFIFNLTGKEVGGAGTSQVNNNIGLVFETLLKNKNAPNLIQNLLEESQDPRLVEGVKSLVFKHLKNKMYTKSELAEGSNVASVAQLGNILDDSSNTLAVVREVFADSPEELQGIIDLLNLQKIVASGRAYKSALTVGSETVENASNVKKIDRLVMFTLGILNPMATKARSLGRAFSSAQEESLNLAFQRTQAALMSSPQFFSWALKSSDKLTESEWIAGAKRFLPRYAFREMFGDKPSLSEEAQMYEAMGETPQQ